MPDKNYDPQAKIRPCERHKSQFIFWISYCIKLVTQVKKKLFWKTKIQTFYLRFFRFKKHLETENSDFLRFLINLKTYVFKTHFDSSGLDTCYNDAKTVATLTIRLRFGRATPRVPGCCAAVKTIKQCGRPPLYAPPPAS